MFEGRQLLRVRVKENLDENPKAQYRWYKSKEEYIVSPMHDTTQEDYYQVMYGRHSINHIHKEDVIVLEKTKESSY